ncbi:hypothetical protein BN7_3714 [Wickerhamomyces ciferrii]|uniref:Uncharacterized protein n=1 Tax=Wickerhamomyces ciferrii (strain ATCC 14091 / BCRC 22168 / CBS 111 / JCM 3599 / NBRC 0793 / NRRL Y-1031 F-60-10) TaxID=1206466 RepID=K0KME6_WICCF|nr:uncharacterized protein BN7_3714 [Wickerhamomyces ciferrii]CCH44156.1 hypothetical protein BN7_3714 [Wickerhamomyces ciferrii]
MTIAPKDSIPDRERERVQNLEKSIQKGRERLGNLTYDELIGTVCLVSSESQCPGAHFLHNIQSDIFKAFTFDPRTSLAFKKDEVFDIIEPQNVGYKRITLKLMIKDYPTLSIEKQGIADIKSFLESRDSTVEIYIQEQLDFTQVLDHLNKFGVPKSDAQIDDEIAKVNRERIPLFLLNMNQMSNALTLQQLKILLMFYSNSLKDVKIDCFRSCFKVVQKQKSSFVNIESTDPHRNFIYHFNPNETTDTDGNETQTKTQDKISEAESIIQNSSFIFQTTNFTNPKLSFHRNFYSVYDLCCQNNLLPDNDSNDQGPTKT